MPAPVAYRQRLSYLRVVIGLVGSLGAIVAFFFTPIHQIIYVGFYKGFWDRSSALDYSTIHESAWELWQRQLANPYSVLVLITFLLLPVCALATLLLGCVGLARPLTRLWLDVFTIAAGAGLLILFLFFIQFTTFLVDWGFYVLVASYVCTLIGYSTLEKAHKSA